MRCYFEPRQLAHAPAQELHNGSWTPHAEHPGRARSILEELSAPERPADQGEAPLLRVHSAEYLAFLRTAFDEWENSGRSGDAAGYTWPIVRRRTDIRPQRIDAKLGLYSYDAATPIAPGTWASAYWGAQTALAATDAVLGGARNAFALCRPPGHHAGRDYLGGYCYLNNAAIAAEAALAAGRHRVAVLDIDYHHGNGTQDIFYERGDVLFVSIHADPATDYPFHWGFTEEHGAGEGEGANLNIILPHGTDRHGYRIGLDKALARIAKFAPELLVCSFGADTFYDDPICHFELRTGDYQLIGADIAELGLPTVTVMEGGYAVDALGVNVANFLGGLGG